MGRPGRFEHETTDALERGRPGTEERTDDVQAEWRVPTLWRQRDIRRAQPIEVHQENELAAPDAGWTTRLGALSFLGRMPRWASLALIAALAFAAGAGVRYSITSEDRDAAPAARGAATEQAVGPASAATPGPEPVEATGRAPEAQAVTTERRAPATTATRGEPATEAAESKPSSERAGRARPDDRKTPAAPLANEKNVERTPSTAPAYAPRRQRPARAPRVRPRETSSDLPSPVVIDDFPPGPEPSRL